MSTVLKNSKNVSNNVQINKSSKFSTTKPKSIPKANKSSSKKSTTTAMNGYSKSKPSKWAKQKAKRKRRKQRKKSSKLLLVEQEKKMLAIHDNLNQADDIVKCNNSLFHHNAKITIYFSFFRCNYELLVLLLCFFF